MRNFLQFTRIGIVFVLLVATFLPSSAQTIRRVTVGGAGNRSGTSWANASQLQAALEASNTAGDQVWIAAGTYNPHATDRTVTFSIPAGVLVYGGFAGNEATLANRAGGATILSGDLLGDDGTRPVRPLATADQTVYNAARAVYDATRDDNSNNTVVTITGANVTLDGLTITAGNLQTYDSGGGLYAGSGTADATLTGCTFTNNEAGDIGGGAFFRSTVTLTDCIFIGNEADSDGGGAHFFTTATLTGCIFTGNTTAANGGGAGFFNPVTLTGCTFTGNTARFGGGAASFNRAATLTNCVVVGNSADRGGGLLLSGGGTVINSTFYNNNTTRSFGGGILVGFDDTDIFTSGIQSDPFTLRNSILVGNTTPTLGTQLYLQNEIASEANIQNNLLEGGVAGIGYRISGSANITETGTIDQSNASAVFASTDAMNTNYLRLKAGSPAVNAGNNAYLNNGTSGNPDDDIKTDAAGKMRIQGGTVDLGAYESDIDTRTAQTITFTPPATGAVGGKIALTATASTGLDVTFEVTGGTGTATLSDNTLSLTGVGTVEVTATQAGNATYATTTKTQTITVRDPLIRRVTTAGNGSADGSTWATAMTLQAALAASTAPGDQVWIAAGTYKPFGVDRAEATFSIPAGVLVYGGFAGNEADNFDPATNARTGGETILSGDLMSDDGTRPVQPAEGEDMTAYNAARAVYDATRDDNSNTVVTITGVNVTLDGLTITAGEGGNPAGSLNDSGAGLYAGAGITGVTLTGCTFTSNSAGNWGGGVAFQEVATLTACTFTGNTAKFQGGGAYFRIGSTVTACTFTGNETRAGNGGGALFGEAATLVACTFTGNEAGSGGGAYFWEASTLTNCVLVGNRAGSSAGLYFRSGGTVINSTLYNNTAGSAAGGIGADFRDTPLPFILRNSILVGNTAGATGPGSQLYVSIRETSDVVTLQNNLLEGGAAAIFYADVSPNITETGTVDESDASVVFASTTAAEASYLRLAVGSPALNAGNNSFIPAGITTDAVGEMRIQGTAVDLGAYEGGVVAPPPADPILRVTATGAGARDGSNWANAMTLQAALAASTTPGDQVWIAGGIYKPHATDRMATFSILTGVLVYGGFAGNEGDDFDPAINDTRTRNAEGVLTNVTTLSGDLSGNDIARPAEGVDRTAYDAARTENSHTVVTITGSNVTLDGLTISGGQGGTAVDAMAFVGAGLLVEAGTTGTTLTDCTFTGNEAQFGSGAFFNAEATTLTGCTFTGNKAVSNGGGAQFQGTATLTGCTFRGNVSDGAAGGAGGASFGGTAMLTDCTFTGNVSAGNGGGAWFFEAATLTNCVLVGNSAISGGGLLFSSGGGTVINSTLYNNTATAEGGGIRVQFDTNNPFILQNSLLVGNTAADAVSGHQVRIDNADAANVVTLQNNLIAGGAVPLGTDQGIVYTTPGSGNITVASTTDQSDAAVVFASTDAMNANYLHLKAGSPAVNAGNNAYLNNGTPANTDDDIKTDVAGNARIQGGTVDLGAYESGMASPAALNIRRVTTAGNGSADGSTWATAMTLQAALAASTAPGDQVWIAAGTYKPFGVDRAVATFSIPAGVLVYGGFAGNEADNFDPATTARTGGETILSGDLMSDDGTRPVQPPASEDQTAYNAARAVYNATRDDNSNTVVTITGSNATLDGLTITAGEGGNPAVFNQGAGLYAGAGITGATLTDCTFTGNEAGSGGGAYFQEVATLTGCTFTNNVAGEFGSGGGAYFRNAATLTGCTFTGNEANEGGGAFFGGESTLTACTFTGNEVESVGGGAYFFVAGTLTNCVLVGNKTAGNSAGLYFRSGGTVINSTLYNNTAESAAGGIGANFRSTLSPFILRNSILVGNTAGAGPQLYVNIQETSEVVTLQKNLIEGGAADIFYADGGTSPNITETGTLDATAAAVFASTDAMNANYLRLKTGSPAVGAGNNVYIPEGIVTDAAGKPRIQRNTVDLGAYESDIDTRTAQIITFTSPDEGAVGETITLAATSDSGLPVTFEITGEFEADGTTPAAEGTVTTLADDGVTLSLVGIGEVEITTTQAGNATYATTTKTQTITVEAALNIRRVTTTGAGNESGSSWANASQLQAALAASTKAGNQVWIAAGTYKPHADDRTATFTIPEGVLVYGGFAGNEADDFDPATTARMGAATILSGDLMSDDGTRPAPPADAANLTPEETAAIAAYDATRTDNSNTVVTIAGENVTLDGLTISGGQGGNPADFNRGAGLYAGSGITGVTLTACTFTDNMVGNQGGGAFFLLTATLTGCTFTGNTAGDNGGGAYFLSGTLTLEACTFTGNTAGDNGGGAYFSTTATLTNCVVVGNRATNTSGGLSFNSGGTVINSTLYNNTADNQGGGIFVAFNTNNPFTLRNSILVGNTAADAASGHQVDVDNGDVAHVATLQNNLIEGGADPMGTDQGVVYATPGAANITQTGTVDEDDVAAVFTSTMAENANYLRLKEFSPAIGAGNNDYVNNATPPITTDAAGAMRIQSGMVDLGAYESAFVTPMPQTLVFTLTGDLISGNTIPLKATSQDADGDDITADGLPAVTYTSSENTIAEVRAVSGGGQELVLKALGLATITASRGGGTAGGVSYAAATPVTQDITVEEAPQTLTFVLAGSGISGNTIALTATSQDGDGTDIAAGLPAVTYTSSEERVALVRAVEGGGQELVLLMNGTTTITASRVGGTIEGVTYAAATPVTQDIMVSAAAQTLVFTLTGDLISGNTIPLTAISQDADGDDITADGLPAITYMSSDENVAEVRAVSGGGQELVLLMNGTTTITVSRGEGTVEEITYAAATAVTQEITVSAATQTLSFPPPNNPVLEVGNEITLTATTQDAGGDDIAGLEVTLAITSAGTVATFNTGTGVLIFVGVGSVTVTASRAAGTADGVTYAAATDVEQTFTVTQGTQTVAITSGNTGQATTTTIALTATVVNALGVDTGSDITYEIVSETPTRPGDDVADLPAGTNMLELIRPGTVEIRATAEGNVNTYAEATDTQEITVTDDPVFPQTFTFNLAAGGTSGDEITLTATSQDAGGNEITGLPDVTFAITPGSNNPTTAGENVATLAADVLTLASPGMISITASRAGGRGDDGVTYAAATAVTQPITVAAAMQILTFDLVADGTSGDRLPLTATSQDADGNNIAAGLPAITYTSSDENVAEVRAVAGGGQELVLLTPGTTTITVSRGGGTAGGVTYAPADDVTQDITVESAVPTAQVIAFDDPTGGATVRVGESIDLVATTDAPNDAMLAIAFTSSATNIAVVVNDDDGTFSLRFDGTGDVTITATQAGGIGANGITYAPATATQTITVAAAAAIAVDQEAVFVAKTAIRGTFEIFSTIRWQLSKSNTGAEWITNIAADGGNSDASSITGENDASITITTIANPNNTGRSTTLTLTAIDQAGNTLTEPAPVTISFTQLGTTHTGDISVTTQAEVDALRTSLRPGTTLIVGNVTIGLELTTSDITDLSPFAAIIEVTGSVVVKRNRDLPNLIGLNQLESIEGDFEVSGNDALTSLGEFPALESIGGGFAVGNNGDLTSLGDFTVLESVEGDFEVSGNGDLTSLGDFTALQSIGGGFEVGENGDLPSPGDFTALQTISGDFEMSDNAALTSLGNFPALQTIGGGFEVSENGDLPSLGGFTVLQSIGSIFKVSGNDLLTSLGDFPVLQTIGGDFEVGENAALASVRDFTVLQTIGGSFEVSGNAAVTSVRDFTALQTIRGSFEVSGNAALNSVRDFPVLQTIGSDFEVSGNADLTSLGNFAVLQSIGGSFEVSGTVVLPSQGDFPALQTIGGSFEIYNNAALTSPGEFLMLTSIGSANGIPVPSTGTDEDNVSILVEGNALLQDCCVLTTFFSDGANAVSGQIFIGDNASGCSSIAEVNCAFLKTNLEVVFTEKATTEGVIKGMFEIFSTLPWQLSKPTTEEAKWITNIAAGDDNSDASSITGENNASITITAAANPENAVRSMTLTLTAMDMAGEALTDPPPVTILFTQLGATYEGDFTLEFQTSATENKKSSSQRERMRAALTNVTAIRGNLIIGNYNVNNDITELRPLRGITHVTGNVEVVSNSRLVSLGFLADLQAIGGNLLVENNNLLEDCCTLAGFLNGETNTVSGRTFIDDNASGCGTTTQVNCEPFLKAGKKVVLAEKTATESTLEAFSRKDWQLSKPSAEVEWITKMEAEDVESDPISIMGENNAFITITTTVNPKNTGRRTKLTLKAIDVDGSALDNMASITVPFTQLGISHTGNVSVATQAEVDALSTSLTTDATRIKGNVTIGSASGMSDIDDLSQFEDIIEITGNVVVRGNLRLTSLAGLSQLQIIGGSFGVNRNAALTSLGDFTDLESIGGSFVVGGPSSDDGNAALLSLGDFRTLQTIGGSFVVERNRSLTSLGDFRALHTIDDSFVVSSFALTSLGDFTALQTIKGDFEVNFTALPSLDYFTALQSIGGTFVVNINDALTSLGNFPALQIIGDDFEVTKNTTLTSLGNFSALQSIGGDFEVTKNDILTSLGDFTALEFIGGIFEVGGNAALTSLGNFAALKGIGGDFDVIDNDALTSLGDFTKLQFMGDFEVENNFVLTSLGDFPVLGVMGDFFVEVNDGLTSLGNFPVLESIEGSFVMNYNDGLTSLGDFTALQTIGGSFGVVGTSALTSLGDFSCLAIHRQWSCDGLQRRPDFSGRISCA